jgi:hypothetical protein
MTDFARKTELNLQFEKGENLRLHLAEWEANTTRCSGRARVGQALARQLRVRWKEIAIQSMLSQKNCNSLCGSDFDVPCQAEAVT